MAQKSPAKAKRRQHHANRRRRTYSLRQQRYTLPLFVLAALAAVIVHLLALRMSPTLIAFWNKRFSPPPQEKVQDEEEIRVVIRQPEELPEADMPDPVNEPTEMEQILQEPDEIDILEMEVPELIMAPGETNIPLPEPEPEQTPDSSPPIEFTPGELDLASLGSSALPDQAEHLPEPTPLNANDVIANATPQSKVLDDAEGLIDSELRRQAKEGGNMPGDTRSLSELMGMHNLGANSGVARLGADLLFAFNESKLKNSARISLLQLAALIHKNPNTSFIIEGHTDGIGGEDYNALLSLLRAAAVCEWLTQNGVPTKRVYMRACGSHRPLVNTRAPRDKQALNRRVEIHMRKIGETLPPGCLPASYPVDRQTPVQTQLKNGVRAPQTGM